ncbi:helicase C-terminal domain-containing protein [Candidatus Latescibacterota bacterium]
MIPADTFISIDLETTGLNPQLNEIIEIGAVKVNDGKITDQYQELVKPRSPIPESITHITGISNEDVAGAGSIEEITPSFLDFISDNRLLGQNVRFDVAFLRDAMGVGNIGEAVDNIELARILLPRLQSYSLDNLIDFFALTPEKRHRALSDAQITADIFLKLIDMLRLVPISFLNEIFKISERTGSNLRDVFESLILERMHDKKQSVSKSIPVFSDISGKNNNIFGDFTSESPPVSESRSAMIDLEYPAKLLSRGGKLSKYFDAYEERPGQIAFTKKIAAAFNDSEILLAEAGTGTGKSVAYLIPSILWAETARERIIISTNTKNLQEQLFYDDIPLLGKVLDFPFRAVILKGRGNYICLHRWQKIIEGSEQYLTKQERSLLLPVSSWLHGTITGDVSETGFFSMLVESGLIDRINSESISCAGSRCPLREQCFVNRVRKAAQYAHIIIVNHSLVFSDMVSDGGVLGPYTRIVFDEAHNIEKIALRYLGVTMSYYRVRRILNRLYSKNEHGYGLFAMLHEWVKNVAKGWPEFAVHEATIQSAVDAVEHLRSVTRELFEQLNTAVRSEVAVRSDGHEGKLRYFDNSPVFLSCADIISAFNDALTALIQVSEDIFMLVSEVSSGKLEDKEDVMIDIEKARQDIQAIVDEFEFLRNAAGRNVFWFEYNLNGSAYSLSIHSAPLDVAEKLAVGLYDHIETVIMTSATLTVARDFSYIRNRLGLDLDTRDRVTDFIAATPFDYQRQSAVFMPTFLPSPKSDNFIEEVNETLFALAKNIGRGMLVLFTSRGHLYRAYNELSDPFMREGITLMGQGIDGSRNLLLRRFRQETRSVLFGTDSFWEGVDVPGRALEIVVIIRLPFAVPTEPIVEAQMEEIERSGGKPFMDYTVPEAAIKLRQGAGRLIRHRNDRGAVIVMDKRVVTTKYGSVFRKCLPGMEIRAENVERLNDGLKRWFE